MVLQETTLTRLFPVALSGSGLMTNTSFGFEAEGRRFFDVTLPGKPRIQQGMTVIALLETPNGFGGKGLLGWVDCHDGTVVCDSAIKYFGMFLLSAFFAIMFSLRAYAIMATPANANLVAFLVAALFGGFAVRFLYISIRAFLVKRALIAVRDFSRATTAEF